MSALKENASASTMTMPSLREIVQAMLLSTFFALCGELINGSLALRLCDFQPQAQLAGGAQGCAQTHALRSEADAEIEFIYTCLGEQQGGSVYYSESCPAKTKACALTLKQQV